MEVKTFLECLQESMNQKFVFSRLVSFSDHISIFPVDLFQQTSLCRDQNIPIFSIVSHKLVRHRPIFLQTQHPLLFSDHILPLLCPSQENTLQYFQERFLLFASREDCPEKHQVSR